MPAIEIYYMIDVSLQMAAVVDPTPFADNFTRFTLFCEVLRYAVHYFSL
jgi:hypothetical protein